MHVVYVYLFSQNHEASSVSHLHQPTGAYIYTRTSSVVYKIRQRSKQAKSTEVARVRESLTRTIQLVFWGSPEKVRRKRTKGLQAPKQDKAPSVCLSVVDDV